jgi:hypothetical protein
MIVMMFLCFVGSSSNCGTSECVTALMRIVLALLAVEFGFFFGGILLVFVAVCELILGWGWEGGRKQWLTEEREKTILALLVLSLLFLQLVLVLLLGCALGFSQVLVVLLVMLSSFVSSSSSQSSNRCRIVTWQVVGPGLAVVCRIGMARCRSIRVNITDAVMMWVGYVAGGRIIGLRRSGMSFFDLQWSMTCRLGLVGVGIHSRV